VKSEMVVEGSELSVQFKSQVSEVKVVPAGESASVVHMTVEYERVDGALLPPEEEARIGQGYLGLIKKVEEYLVAHPHRVRLKLPAIMHRLLRRSGQRNPC